MYTKREGYLITFFLLDLIWKKNEVQSFLRSDEKDDFGLFLGSMNPFIFSDSMSADLAYWEDWIKCLIIENDDEFYSQKEIIDAAIRFVDFYIYNFKFKVNFIKEELVRFKNNIGLRVLDTDDFRCMVNKVKDINESI